MCGHYSVKWYTQGSLLLGATHLSLIKYFSPSLFVISPLSPSLQDHILGHHSAGRPGLCRSLSLQEHNRKGGRHILVS